MKDLAVVWVAAKRTWIKTLRWPGTLTFSFVQPLMWIVFFGFLMQKFELRGLPAGISYRDFYCRVFVRDDGFIWCLAPALVYSRFVISFPAHGHNTSTTLGHAFG
ncbi:MAG: hypothetical protein R3A45_08115 [Bdellovibrionota bacterium]